MTSKAVSNTKTIARNSFWYGLETSLDIVVAFATSIPMARVLGPESVGYFSLVMWIVGMSALVGSLGAPAATRKYMAEFLGQGQPGKARAVFRYTFRLQVLAALALTVIGALIGWKFGDASYRWITYCIIACILPSMLTMIPSQANVANENTRANVPGSLISQVLYTLAVWLSLWFDWGLLGIAIGILVYKWVEFAVRMIPAVQWMKSLPDEPLDPDVRLRLRSYSNKSIFVMLLNILVWNRSDLLLLRWLNPDVRQLAFFSLSQNLSEKVTLLPRAFSAATGSSLMAQYGRDKERLAGMLGIALQYLLMVALPLLWGLSSVSTALVPLMYGPRYLEAIPVLALAALAAVPASIFVPAQNYLEATERQRYIILWTCVAAGVNIAVDILLIPRWGALGAAVGNASGQAVAACGLWLTIIRLDSIVLPWKRLGRIAVSAGLLYMAAFAVVRFVPSGIALPLAVVLGAVVYLFGIRCLRVLGADDLARLSQILYKVPALFREHTRRVFIWMTNEPAVR